MNLYQIMTSEIEPIFFVKESKEAALACFKDSIDEDEYNKYTSDKSFKIIQVTSLEHFISLLNTNEFTIDPDTVICS